MALLFRDIVEGLFAALPPLRWLGVPFYYGTPAALLYGPCFVPRPMRERIREMITQFDIDIDDDQLAACLEDLLGPIASGLLDAPTGIHLPVCVEDFWRSPEELARDSFDLLGIPPDPKWIETAAGFLRDHLEAVHDLLSRHDFEVTPKVVAQFIVLHELGHYVDWASAPDRKTWELEALNVSWDLSGQGYRALPRETWADNFALVHLRVLYPRGPLGRLARGVYKFLGKLEKEVGVVNR